MLLHEDHEIGMIPNPQHSETERIRDAKLQAGPEVLPEFQLISRPHKSAPLEKMAALVSGLCDLIL